MALKKMVVDQFCFVPVFFTVLMPVLWVSQGMGPQLIAERMKQVRVDYWNSLMKTS